MKKIIDAICELVCVAQKHLEKEAFDELDVSAAMAIGYLDSFERLKKAEERKTLLHLPCAIGDTVWCALEDTARLYGGVYEAIVDYIDWSSDDWFKITVRFVSDEQPVSSIKFLEWEFGLHVFFGEDAKEKAEEALKKMEEEKGKCM